MELALRRSWGYAFSPSLNYQPGMQGLGDTICDDFGDCYDSSTPDTPLPAVSTSGGSTYSQLITQGVSPADAYAYDPAGAIASGYIPPVSTVSTPVSTAPLVANCPDGTPPWSDGSCVTCSDGSVPWSDGSCGAAPATAGAVSANSVAAIAAALAKAVAATAPKVAGGVPTCPAGYVYGAAGQSVTIAPGVSTVGTGKCLPSTAAASTSIIAGVSNTNLAIAVAIILTIAMASGSKGKR